MKLLLLCQVPNSSTAKMQSSDQFDTRTPILIAIIIQECESRSYDILASSIENDSVASSVDIPGRPIEIVKSFAESLNPGADRITAAVQPDLSDS